MMIGHWEFPHTFKLHSIEVKCNLSCQRSDGISVQRSNNVANTSTCNKFNRTCFFSEPHYWKSTSWLKRWSETYQMHLGRTKCFEPPAKVVDKLLRPRHVNTAHFNLNPLCKTKFIDACRLPQTCMLCYGPYVSPAALQWGLNDKSLLVGLDCHQSQAFILTCNSYRRPVKAGAVILPGNMALTESEILQQTCSISISILRRQSKMYLLFHLVKLLVNVRR